MEDLFRWAVAFLNRWFRPTVVEPALSVINSAPWIDSGAGRLRDVYQLPGGGNAHQRRKYRRRIERIIKRGNHGG